MNKITLQIAAPADQAVEVKNPVLVIRKGRGRLGGSTVLDLMIQRARHYGRRAQPLDGDLRSGTLAALYPAVTPKGEPIQDGASRPPTEELPAMKAWLMSALDDMALDRISRALDLGGGDRVVQEFVRDMPLGSYCADFGIDLLSVYMLGPDPEDFRHVIELVRASDMKAERALLVMNEGVIRQGQSVDGVFDPILHSPDMKALVKDGVHAVYLRRLTCMHLIREHGFGFYEAAYGEWDRNSGRPRPSPTLQHMTKIWLKQNEEQHTINGTAEWLP